MAMGIRRRQKINTRAKSVITVNDNFGVVESYKAIRTNLSFALTKKGCKVVMISSTMPGEGKSTTVVNLGVAISQNNTRVLIVDCDLRKARTHRFFEIKNDNGVSNVLCNMCVIDDAIDHTEYENLDIMTAGTLPPNPGELLASEAMAEMIHTLEERYDYILIDTPPINVVADALSLTKLVDGVVLIVRQGQTTHPNVKDALSSLEFAGAKMLGVVLNGSYDTSGFGSSKYGNRYGNRYGNAYAYGERTSNH